MKRSSIMEQRGNAPAFPFFSRKQPITCFCRLILFLSGIYMFISCSEPSYQYIQGFAQGTTYHITYNGSKDYSVEIDSILKKFDLSLSAYIDSSLISKVNRNEPDVRLDKWFTDVFRKSEEVYETSDGLFDITVGPLVKAWGFLKDTKSKHLDSAHIAKLLTLVGMNKIHLENNRLVKDNPNVIIDVNALAQGYSVDVISEYLEEQGVANYMVEIGGEVRAKGKNPKNNPWRIGIDKPIDNNQLPGDTLQTIIKLEDKAIATSGNYRKFFVEDGIKYTHTINPKTGYPSKNNLLSVSILANDCMTADAYATACLASGLEKSKKLISKVKLEGYLVFSDSSGNFKTYITEGFKSIIAH